MKRHFSRTDPLIPGTIDVFDSVPNTDSQYLYSSSAASEASNSSKENISESNMAVDRQSTPPLQSQANGARRYLNSPAAAKRKRMEELAERLRKKKHL